MALPGAEGDRFQLLGHLHPSADRKARIQLLLDKPSGLGESPRKEQDKVVVLMLSLGRKLNGDRNTLSRIVPHGCTAALLSSRQRL